MESPLFALRVDIFTPEEVHVIDYSLESKHKRTVPPRGPKRLPCLCLPLQCHVPIIIMGVVNSHVSACDGIDYRAHLSLIDEAAVIATIV